MGMLFSVFSCSDSIRTACKVFNSLRALVAVEWALAISWLNGAEGSYDRLQFHLVQFVTSFPE